MGFKVDSRIPILALAVVMVAFLALVPIAWLLFGSVWSGYPGEPGEITLKNYVEVLSSSETYEVLTLSIIYALGSSAISVFFGFSIAWIIVKTNTPFKRSLEIMAIMPYMMPMIVLSISYVFLFSPTIGMLNHLFARLFGLDGPVFDIHSLGGMMWVMGIFEAPLAFLIISAALKSMDSSLEENARVMGSTILGTLRRVVIPVTMPAILASFTLNIVRALEIFDIPAILGIPKRIFVFPTLIYKRLMLGVPPDVGGATSLAIILFVITLLLILVYRYFTRQTYRYATLAPKGHKPAVNDIGKWRYLALAFVVFYFVVTVALPIGTIVFVSFMQRYKIPTMEDLYNLTIKNYVELFNFPAMSRAFFNSIFLAVAGATLGILLASLAAYITVKTNVKGRGVLEGIAFLPFATPGIILAVGLTWAYVYIPIGIYGTIWILMVAYITRFLPFGIRSVSASLIQLHKELEESSRTLGASWFRSFRSVVLPLIKPGIIAGWILLSIIFLRELSMSIILSKAGSEVLPVVIFDLYDAGYWVTLSALGVVMLLITFALTAIALKLGRAEHLAI